MQTVAHRESRPASTNTFHYPGSNTGFPPGRRPLQPQEGFGPPFRHGPGSHTAYAPPTVSQSSIGAIGTMIPPPQSFPRDLAPAGPQSVGSFLSQMTAYGSTARPGQDSQPAQPAWTTYTNPPPPPPPPPSSTQAPYHYSLFPRATGISPTINMAGPEGGYHASSLRLPPILPAPAGPYSEIAAVPQPLSRLQPAAPATSGPPGPESASRQRDHKRPRMDIKGILAPRND